MEGGEGGWGVARKGVPNSFYSVPSLFKTIWLHSFHKIRQLYAEIYIRFVYKTRKILPATLKDLHVCFINWMSLYMAREHWLRFFYVKNRFLNFFLYRILLGLIGQLHRRDCIAEPWTRDELNTNSDEKWWCQQSHYCRSLTNELYSTGTGFNALPTVQTAFSDWLQQTASPTENNKHITDTAIPSPYLFTISTKPTKQLWLRKELTVQ